MKGPLKTYSLKRSPREVTLCETVLTEIVELDLKFRLFAFVDRTMEQYKRTTKEQIQKSKSLRTKLKTTLSIRSAPIIRKNNIKITVPVPYLWWVCRLLLC